MRKDEVTCPICTSDMPLTGDEKDGDEFFCSCCGSPGIFRGGDDDDDLEIEEDL